MKKKFFIVVVFNCIFGYLFFSCSSRDDVSKAEDISVKLTIVDKASNVPIIGAKVSFLQQLNPILSNLKGNVYLKLKKSNTYTIHISAMGYIANEVRIRPNNLIDNPILIVELSSGPIFSLPDSIQLQEGVINHLIIKNTWHTSIAVSVTKLSPASRLNIIYDFDEITKLNLEINETKVIKIVSPLSTSTVTQFMEEVSFTFGDFEKRLKVEIINKKPIIYAIENVNFQNTSLSTTSTYQLTVSNRGTALLKIDSLEITNGFLLNWHQAELVPNTSKTLQLTFEPTEIRLYNGTLKFITGSTIIKTVALAGVGVAELKSEIALNEEIIDYGLLLPNSEKTKMIRVSNIGQKKLVINNIILPEGFTTDWLSAEILPEESKTLNISFTPSSSVFLTKTIVIESDADQGRNVFVAKANSNFTYIPDDNFEKALIDLGLDSGVLDDYILTAQISNLENLVVKSKQIRNLKGIENFKMLKKLECQQNLLTSLDLSQNIKLTSIKCYDNDLTNLNTSGLLNITTLWVYKNNLTTLDVTENINLKSLRGYDNLLQNVYISSLIKLETLWLYNNQITTLNIKNNIKLTNLRVQNNNLSKLDLSKNVLLTTMYASDNLGMSCIQIFPSAPISSSKFKKDASTSYNINCNY